MKNVFENIKAAEITENDIEKIAGGAIVYDNGTFDLYSGDTLVASYWNYDDAYSDALWYGIGTTYYSSLTNYRNSRRKNTRRRRTTNTVYYSYGYEPEYTYHEAEQPNPNCVR